MWKAKILEPIDKEDGSQENEIICCIVGEDLKTVYNTAMRTCKKHDIALAAIYKDMSLNDVINDDPTKLITKSVYHIYKGGFGSILLLRRYRRQNTHIRENRTLNR